MNIITEIFLGFKDAFEVIGKVLSISWFVIFPVTFYNLFMFLWKKHIGLQFDNSIDWVMLEIIPPKEIERSPKLMESIYSGIAGTDKGYTIAEKYIQGMFPYYFGFEIVGKDGAVHFYIKTPKAFRSLIEANFYAQYPSVEIHEVSDYVDDVPKVIPNKDWTLWGLDFQLVKPDPYPIRTYPSFEESVTGGMIDPLAAIVEVMGKLPPGQQIWYQCVISPIPPKEWMVTGKKEVDALVGKIKKKQDPFEKIFIDIKDIFVNLIGGLWGNIAFTEAKKEEKPDPLEFRLTPGEKEVLKALERNTTKDVFLTKMRFILIGRRENFDKSFASAFIGGMKQFADMNSNSFKPHDRSKTYANYIFTEERLRYRQRKLLKRYRDRDQAGKSFIMSTEELATIYHLPDISVMAPSVPRVEAKRGGAPSNLPIG